MSSLQDINPVDPLLWVEGQPLIALTYLWHMSRENFSQESEKVDLLWKLTKQLLLATHHQNDYPIPKEELESLVAELEKDRGVTALLKSEVISRDILIQILRIQEIDFRYRQNHLNHLQSQLRENDSEIRAYYEQNESLTFQNSYEVYEYRGEKKIQNLPKEEIAHFQCEELVHLGFLNKDELDEISSFKKWTEEDLPICLPHSKKTGITLLVKAFYDSYKAPYEMVKPRLVEIFAHSISEQQLEEEAQKYLETSPVEYNEEVLNKVLQLKNL